ncbi:MAG: 6-carboxytetrahydropterin synthase [Phycisphaerae bacterium]|nr:6-carboxytetrahydropterin synthase [Phycisphaerae bacterium]
MATYELTIESEFSAAHRLRMYDGAYEPLHGHNWKVECYFEADRLDEIGVAADFTLLRDRVLRAVGELHDTYLNDLAPFAGVNPSTENVARHLYERIAVGLASTVRLRRVRVWEAAGCAASYSP